MAEQRPARFAPGLSQDDLKAGYERVSNRTPFKKTDVQRAYEPYKLTLGGRKEATDAQLYKQASGAVVDWWKRQQQEKARLEAERRAQAEAQARAAAAAQQAPVQPARPASVAPAPAAPSAPQPDWWRQMLIASGLPNARPPAYALASADALAAWIRRAKVYSSIPILPKTPEVIRRPSPTGTVAVKRTVTNRNPGIR